MIHAFGCSYTYGTSCINPETDSWPAKLATLLSNDYKNYGVEGASNDYIFKTLAQNLKFIKKDDTIIIMMTKANRRYFKNIHITPYSTHNIAEVFYKYINDDQGDCINFLQNLNAFHFILKNFTYLITFMDARPLLECSQFDLGLVAEQKINTYIPKRLGFNRYIEDIDNLHPSNKGHISIANELYKGFFNEK